MGVNLSRQVILKWSSLILLNLDSVFQGGEAVKASPSRALASTVGD